MSLLDLIICFSIPALILAESWLNKPTNKKIKINDKVDLILKS
jgi:hypothetical protein